MATTAGLGGETNDWDEVELLALLEPVLPLAQRLAHGMLDGRPEADDALQEALLKAWRHFGRFDRTRPIGPWFMAIVANECRMQRRSRWWSLSRVERAVDAPVGGGQPSDQVTDLRTSVRRLPHDERLILVLRYYLDQSFDEIGRTLGISSQAAKSRTRRALKQLKLEVQVEDD